jgi:hypothetical protein
MEEGGEGKEKRTSPSLSKRGQQTVAIVPSGKIGASGLSALSSEA